MLPIIIFAEAHADPITAQQMDVLLPFLKTSGYEKFYDEILSVNSVNDTIKLYQEKQAYRDKLMLLAQKFNSDPALTDDGLLSLQEMHNPATQEEVLQLIKLLIYEHAKGNRSKYFGISAAIHKNPSLGQLLFANLNYAISAFGNYNASTSAIEFLNHLKDSGITYQGIDSLNSKRTHFTLKSTTTAIYDEKRNIQMANAFLSANVPIFGRIGLLHVDPIKKEFLNVMSPEEFDARYCIIYIKTNKSNAPEIQEFTKNCTIINAEEMKHDDIQTEIKSIIQAKSTLAEQLKPQWLQQTKSELTGYIAKRTEEHKKHTFSYFSDHFYPIQISAANKFLSYLNENEVITPVFSNAEINVLAKNKPLNTIAARAIRQGMLKPLDELRLKTEKKPSMSCVSI